MKTKRSDAPRRLIKAQGLRVIKGKGRVRGSPELFNREKKRIEAEVNRLEVKSVLRELNRVADSIEQDEPNAKRSDLPG
jgi:hypothetical protein